MTHQYHLIYLVSKALSSSALGLVAYRTPFAFLLHLFLAKDKSYLLITVKEKKSSGSLGSQSNPINFCL